MKNDERMRGAAGSTARAYLESVPIGARRYRICWVEES